MNTTTLNTLNTLVLTLAAASSAIAMPNPQVDDLIVSSGSLVTARDNAFGQVDWDDDLGVGFQWADANQSSVANASVPSGAAGHAHGASEAQETAHGFKVWAYSYGSSYAEQDQEVEFDASGGGQFGFDLQRPTRVTGYACTWENAPESRGQTRAILWGNTDQGFVRPLDHMAGGAQDCINFQFVLEPGAYEFNINSWILVTNDGDGQNDSWSESEAELKFEELAHPDVDFDGDVDGSDLAKFLGAWGTDMWEHDFNEDGIVDGGDLTILLGMWTS
jgi:hypothetical protein